MKKLLPESPTDKETKFFILYFFGMCYRNFLSYYSCKKYVQNYAENLYNLPLHESVPATTEAQSILQEIKYSYIKWREVRKKK